MGWERASWAAGQASPYAHVSTLGAFVFLFFSVSFLFIIYIYKYIQKYFKKIIINSINIILQKKLFFKINIFKIKFIILDKLGFTHKE